MCRGTHKVRDELSARISGNGSTELKRFFGAVVIVTRLPTKANPRNSQPRAGLTLLFFSFTTSFRCCVRYRWTDANTRTALRSLRTKMTKSSA